MLAEIKKDIRNNFPFIHSAYAAIITYSKHQSSRRKIRCLLKDKSPIFLEVGAGNKKGEGGYHNREQDTLTV